LKRGAYPEGISTYPDTETEYVVPEKLQRILVIGQGR
jgi:hypothetical protein